MTVSTLGRTGLKLSAFGAGLGLECAGAPLDEAAEAPNWCDLPAAVTADQWAGLIDWLARKSNTVASLDAPTDDGRRPELLVQVRMRPDRWDRQMRAGVEQVLRYTGRPAVDLLQLAPFDLERIKAGEPFRRLQELRDSGQVRFFSVWTDSVADARWVIENTPVHAVTINVPRGEEDWLSLLDLAAEADTGLIASPTTVNGSLNAARQLLADTPIAAFTWPVDVE